MKNTITPNSPKNKFKIEFNYNKPLSGIGSVASFKTMNILNVKQSSHYSHYASMAKDGARVIIRENKKTFPEFDWQIVEQFDI